MVDNLGILNSETFRAAFYAVLCRVTQVHGSDVVNHFNDTIHVLGHIRI